MKTTNPKKYDDYYLRLANEGYRVARQKGAGVEDAEDFSQWLVMRDLEGYTTEFVGRRFVDWLRWRNGRTGSSRERATHINWYDEVAVMPKDPCEFKSYIKRVSGLDQTLLEMHYKYDWTLEEIGAHYGKTMAWAMGRIYRAIAKIRKHHTKPIKKFDSQSRAV